LTIWPGVKRETKVFFFVWPNWTSSLVMMFMHKCLVIESSACLLRTKVSLCGVYCWFCWFITPHQSGFTPGDSAINQLLSLTNEFGKVLDKGKEIRVVFCDISKAFDRVWQKVWY
jgi:hypothetical protein